MQDFIFAFAGLASAVSGVRLIFEAWTQRQARHAAKLIAGWTGIALSVFLWTLVTGLDRAVAFTTASVMLTAIAQIVLITDWRRSVALPGTAQRGETHPSANGWRQGMRGSAVTLLAGPIALIISILSGLLGFVLAGEAGWTDADQLALAMILVPLAWAGFAVIAALNLRLRWRASVMIGTAVLSAGLLGLLA